MLTLFFQAQNSSCLGVYKINLIGPHIGLICRFVEDFIPQPKGTSMVYRPLYP